MAIIRLYLGKKSFSRNFIVCIKVRIHKFACDSHISESLIVFIVHSFLFARFADQIESKMWAHDIFGQNNEFLFYIGPFFYLK